MNLKWTVGLLIKKQTLTVPLARKVSSSLLKTTWVRSARKKVSRSRMHLPTWSTRKTCTPTRECSTTNPIFLSRRQLPKCSKFKTNYPISSPTRSRPTTQRDLKSWRLYLAKTTSWKTKCFSCLILQRMSCKRSRTRRGMSTLRNSKLRSWET